MLKKFSKLRGNIPSIKTPKRPNKKFTCSRHRRSLLDVLIESLAQGEEVGKKAQPAGESAGEGEEAGKKTQPCNSEAARILTLVVYLVSQPAIKAPLLHLFRSRWI